MRTVRLAFWFLFLILLAQACLAEESVLPGEIVTFGRYEQDNDSSNGAEPVEWQVLEVADGKALLLSRYGLDAVPYHTERVDVTWETCSLRRWLNGEFLKTAFTAAERKSILTTAVDNSAAQGAQDYETNGGRDTQDRVFLLSVAEADRYFGGIPEWDTVAAKMESRAAPTKYAVARGAWTSDTDKTPDGEQAGWWYLRSPGYNQNGAVIVNADGTRYFDYVHSESEAVRPALWVNLDALP